MDHIHSNTIEDVRTPGRHLSLEERGMIQALHRQGLSLRDIAAAVGCAHTTVFYELRRGTPDRKSKHGRAPQYMAKRGQQAYAKNRKNSRKPCKIDHNDCGAVHPMDGRTSPSGMLVPGCLSWLCQAE